MFLYTMLVTLSCSCVLTEKPNSCMFISCGRCSVTLKHRIKCSLIIRLKWHFIKCNISPHREGLSVDITALAQEVFDILSAPANPVSRTVSEREKRKKSQFFINSSNKKAKSVTLHIQGLDSTVSRLTLTHTHTLLCLTVVIVIASKLTNTISLSYQGPAGLV